MALGWEMPGHQVGSHEDSRPGFIHRERLQRMLDRRLGVQMAGVDHESFERDRAGVAPDERAAEKQRELQRGLPISGIGGITTWRDAAEFMALGAGSVQVCTAAMHYGFRIVDDMISGLSNWMDVQALRNRMISGQQTVLLDVRWALGNPHGHEQYRSAHIPGAVYADLDTALSDQGVVEERSAAQIWGKTAMLGLILFWCLFPFLWLTRTELWDRTKASLGVGANP